MSSSNNNNNNTGEVGGTWRGRIFDFFGSIPFTVRLLLLVNWMIYLLGWFIEMDLLDYTICIMPLYKGQWYRILSNAYFHFGFFHIFFNMTAFFSTAKQIEELMGTFALLCQTILFTIVNSFFYLMGCWLLFFITKDQKWKVDCAAGFSGVIFSFLMMEPYLLYATGRAGNGTRNCCTVDIPLKIYPLVLLVLISVMMQSVSFLGHLCGILSGYLYGRGLFSILPLQRAYMARLDVWISTLIRMNDSRLWIKYPFNDPLVSEYFQCIRQPSIPCCTLPTLPTCGSIGNFCNRIKEAWRRNPNNDDDNNDNNNQQPPRYQIRRDNSSLQENDIEMGGAVGGNRSYIRLPVNDADADDGKIEQSQQSLSSSSSSISSSTLSSSSPSSSNTSTSQSSAPPLSVPLLPQPSAPPSSSVDSSRPPSLAGQAALARLARLQGR